MDIYPLSGMHDGTNIFSGLLLIPYLHLYFDMQKCFFMASEFNALNRKSSSFPRVKEKKMYPVFANALKKLKALFWGMKALTGEGSTQSLWSSPQHPFGSLLFTVYGRISLPALLVVRWGCVTSSSPSCKRNWWGHFRTTHLIANARPSSPCPALPWRCWRRRLLHQLVPVLL